MFEITRVCHWIRRMWSEKPPPRQQAPSLQVEALEERYALAADLDPFTVDGPTSALRGSNISVLMDIDNRGNTASGTFGVGYYLSSDPVITTSDLFLKVASRTSIGAYNYQRWYESIGLPSGIAPGNYYLGAIADPSNAVAETSESNNAQADSLPINIIAPVERADLKGNWMDAQSTAAQWGQTIAVQKAQVFNAGAGAAGSFRVEWYLSRDRYGSNDDILLPLGSGAYSYTHGGLAANTLGSEFSVSLRLPNAMPAGWSGSSFHIIMRSDAGNQVLETNENNNFGALGQTYDWDQVSITAPVQPADLQGYWTDAQDPSTQWGQTINVSRAQVYNAGFGAAGSFRVEWYLSRDRYGSTDDILLPLANGASSYVHGGIAAQSYGPQFAVSLHLPANLPAGWSGSTFYVIMKCDAANQVQETNKNNNFGAFNQTYDWDQVSITIPQTVLLSDVRFVSQVHSQYPINNFCQYACAAMLAGKAFGQPWATADTMLALAANATLSDGSGQFNQPASVYNAQAALWRVTQNTRATVVRYGTFDAIKDELRNGRPVSVSVQYSALGAHRFLPSFSGGHQIVVIGFNEANQTWTYLDPLAATNGVKTVAATTFQAAIQEFAGQVNGFIPYLVIR